MTIATFEYDGARRRTEKVAAGLTHTYVYDAEDIIEERISGTGSDTIRYYHGAGIDEPLARKNSSDVVTYYLADHLGSIAQETNASGAVTLEREYDAWGVLTQGSGASGYAFTGREWDAETGLYYYRARYYSAATGQFLGEDPIRTSGSLFSYVANAPLVHTDPTGQFIWVLPFVPAALTAAEAAVIATVGVLVTGALVEKIKNTWSSSDVIDVPGPNRLSLVSRALPCVVTSRPGGTVQTDILKRMSIQGTTTSRSRAIPIHMTGAVGPASG